MVTVLFADVVGFTTLAETRDPEQVKHLVDRCFQWLVADILRFGGRVDKIIGDAVVALFGAPVAHEDDAERAVRAALCMQQTVADRAAELDDAVRLRIGVNTGEVLVGALQAGGDYTAMGDVVNTANRLQTAAEPGEVLVGEATWSATRRVIGYDSRGVVPAKGREAPVQGWVATEPFSAPGVRPGRAQGPLVGRDNELGLLTRSVDTALNHARGAFLLILGDAGMGKTRLASELAARLKCDHGATVYEGRCVPYGEVNAWWPIADALRHAAGLDTSDPPVQVRASVRDLVAAAAGPEGDPAEVSRTTAGLMQLFGYEETRLDLDPDRAHDEIVRAVIAYLEDAAHDRPVVVQLSDLHWADPIVLDLLTTVLERLARRPFVLVATARRGLLESWQPPVGRFDTVALNLEVLDDAATDQLLDVLIQETEQGALPDEARAVLRERSGGNPFFLEELVALLDGRGAVPTGPSALSAGSLGALPDTLRGLVAARLDRLGPVERAVIDDAAVLGRRGRVEHLSEMARIMRQATDIDAAMAELAERELLVVNDDHWEFRSDLTREVAYHTLTKLDRAERHLGVAKWIEHHHEGHWSDVQVDALAHHYGVAAELLTDLGAVDQLSGGVRADALNWVDEAAARAEKLRLLPAVERLCTQALLLAGPEPSPIRLGLLLRRARARVELRESWAAEADAAEADEVATHLDDPRGRASVLLVRGDLQQKAGELAAALLTLDAAVAGFEAAGDDEGRAEALRTRAIAELFAGRLEEAERSALEALTAFRSLGRRRGEAWALQNLAWVALSRGRADEANHYVDSSLAVFHDLGDAGGAAWARGLQAFLRFQEGDAPTAIALQEQVLAEARANGDQWAIGMMLLLGATIRCWTGRTDEAVTYGEEGLALFQALHDGFGQARIVWPLGRALAMSGRVTEGVTVLEETWEAAEQQSPEDRGVTAGALGLHVGAPGPARARVGGARVAVGRERRPRRRARRVAARRRAGAAPTGSCRRVGRRAPRRHDLGGPRHRGPRHAGGRGTGVRGRGRHPARRRARAERARRSALELLRPLPGAGRPRSGGGPLRRRRRGAAVVRHPARRDRPHGRRALAGARPPRRGSRPRPDRQLRRHRRGRRGLEPHAPAGRRGHRVDHRVRPRARHRGHRLRPRLTGTESGTDRVSRAA